MTDAVQAQIEARSAEKSAIVDELARHANVLAEIELRLAVARRKVAEVQQRASTLRNERAHIDSQFQRRAGTRGAGVEDARKQLRSALVDFGRQSLASAPPELASSVLEVARVEEAAQRADRAVRAHEAAITSADQKKLMQGIVVAAGFALLILVLLFFPFIYRSIVVSDPTAP